MGSDLCLPHMVDPPRKREYSSCDNVPDRVISGTFFFFFNFRNLMGRAVACALKTEGGTIRGMHFASRKSTGPAISPARQLAWSLHSPSVAASQMPSLPPIYISSYLSFSLSFLFFTIGLYSVFNVDTWCLYLFSVFSCSGLYSSGGQGLSVFY